MIRKQNIKILTINLDYTLAMDNPEFGDAQRRNIDYGKYVKKIFSITHSSRKLKLKHKKLSDRVEVFPTSSINPCFFIFDAFKIARLIFKDHKIDLILTQDPFITGLVGYLLKLKYGCRFLIHFHGDFWQNGYWLKEKWYNPIFLSLSRFLVKQADGIRVVSSGIKDKLIKEGVKKSKVRVIPTLVDLKKFENYDYEKVASFQKEHAGKKTIINVGRNDSAKDYPTLLKTVLLVYEKYHNLFFWQIGANLEFKRRIKTNNGLLFSSTDKINHEELTNYYHAADVYMSSSKHESLGKVLIEAMACGLPVVATATTGSKEIIVDGQNGFLVPIGDEETLARKIIYLLNNPEIAKKMGETGQQMVKEKFNQETILKNIINFWRDLCVF